MPQVRVLNQRTRDFLEDIEEVTILYSPGGRILGTWVPAGSPPPVNPPEPPTAAAAVGAFVPRKPLSGGPGAAVIPETHDEDVYGVNPEMSVAYRSGRDD